MLCMFSSKFTASKSSIKKYFHNICSLGTVKIIHKCTSELTSTLVSTFLWVDAKETNWIWLLPLLLHYTHGCWPAHEAHSRCPWQRLVKGLKQFLNSKGMSFAKRFTQLKRTIQPTQGTQIWLLGLPWCFLENSVTSLEEASNLR